MSLGREAGNNLCYNSSMELLLIGAWLIVYGLALAGWVNFNPVFLGVFAIVVGIVCIVKYIYLHREFFK
jgi:hypothetical protein